MLRTIVITICMVWILPAYAQEVIQVGCRALEHCLTNADLLRSECKNATTNGTTRNSQLAELQSCVPGVKKKLAKLDEMQAVQRRQYRDCIFSRVKLAVAVNGKEKQDQCQKLVVDYRRTIKSSESNEGLPREDLDSSLIVRTRRDGEISSQCAKQYLEDRLKKCTELAACCSESTFCELEYQLTTLHDEIALQQMATFIEMRRCAQREGKGANAKSTSRRV